MEVVKSMTRPHEITVIKARSDAESEPAPTVMKVIEYGFTSVNETGKPLAYKEPRTGVPMPLYEAVLLIKAHATPGGRWYPIAIEKDSAQAIDAEAFFRRPADYEYSALVQRDGGTLKYIDLEVWFDVPSEVHRFLSVSGHNKSEQ